MWANLIPSILNFVSHCKAQQSCLMNWAECNGMNVVLLKAPGNSKGTMQKHCIGLNREGTCILH